MAIIAKYLQLSMHPNIQLLEEMDQGDCKPRRLPLAFWFSHLECETTWALVWKAWIMVKGGKGWSTSDRSGILSSPKGAGKLLSVTVSIGSTDVKNQEQWWDVEQSWGPLQYFSAVLSMQHR